MNARTFTLLFIAPCLAMTLTAAHAQHDMQPVGRFEIDRTEVTIGQFRQFVNATKTITQAEAAGGGSTFENGWEQRRGWVWHSPYGNPGSNDEPVAHVTFDDSQRFCRATADACPPTLNGVKRPTSNAATDRLRGSPAVSAIATRRATHRVAPIVLESAAAFAQ